MRIRLLAILAFGLLCLPASAASHWVEIRSPHFVVLTDADEATGRRTAGQLERMRAFFQSVLPNASNDADLPITVLALQDENSFKSVIPAAYLAKGQARLAGFFSPMGDRNYITLETDLPLAHPYSVIYHEYTHFILRKDYWLPLWLNEGMAQYFENTDINNSQISFGQPDFNQVRYLNQRMQLLPLPVLFKVDHRSPYYHEEDKISVFYIESWALTHMLETEDFQNKTQRIPEYNRRIAGGEDPVSAAQHAFGDLDALQKQLTAYVAQIGFQGIRLRMNFNIDDSTFKASPISTDQADVVRADVLIHDGRAAEAKALVQPILQRDPNNELALRDMAFITAAEHDQKGARKWLEQAADLDPQDCTANYYAAAFEYGDSAASATRETHLRRCVKFAPSFAPAYNDLADLLITQNRNLDEAHMLSIQAVQLDPSSLTFRYAAAEALEAQHNPDSALMVLTEAKARVARTPAQLAEIDKRIARLQQAQPAAPNPQPSASVAASH
ncbi:MAG TPA: DUF1570 domain-containing protein [Acidobacteriaceae bacterium]|nr:DUF1570 domain-containing protein [Acidobacteriaceae bacterium]